MSPGLAQPTGAALRADQLRGLLLGCALGDAVGLATEFMTEEEAGAAYSGLLSRRAEAGEPAHLRPGDAVVDGHRSKWLPGDWTDDTDQTILVLRTMLPPSDASAGDCGSPSGGLRAPDPLEFARSLVAWHLRGFPELGDTGGCGMGRTTARVVDDQAFLHDPRAAARLAWETTGRCLAPNGALMRAAITGIRGTRFAAQDAAAIAEVTHADPRSTAACVAVATATALMLEGVGRTPAGGWDAGVLAAGALAAAERHLPDASELGVPPPQVWACSACTMENAPTAEHCSICGAPAPASGSGTINAGFGGAWSQQEAAERAYDRGPALAELRAAVLGAGQPGAGAAKGWPRMDGPLMGYVNTCLAAGFCALRAACAGGRPVEEAAFCSAVHALTMAAGDADTNAAVAGALLGCAAGARRLPAEWLRACPHHDWLEKIADALVEAALGPDQCSSGCEVATSFVPADPRHAVDDGAPFLVETVLPSGLLLRTWEPPRSPTAAPQRNTAT